MYHRTTDAIRPTAIQPVRARDLNQSKDLQSRSAAVDSELKLRGLIRDVEAGSANKAAASARNSQQGLPKLQLSGGINEPQVAFHHIPRAFSLHALEEGAEEYTPAPAPAERKQARRSYTPAYTSAYTPAYTHAHSQKSSGNHFLSLAACTTVLVLSTLFGGKEVCQAFNLFNRLPANAQVTTKDRGPAATRMVSCLNSNIAPMHSPAASANDESVTSNGDTEAQADIDGVDSIAPTRVEEKRSANGYKQALPGFKFQFPADHGSHDDYKYEWWYYSGHLKSKAGKTYGFELTFFRLGGDYEAQNPKSAWKGESYNVAHFALTDENGKTFFIDEKINHGRATAAGARKDLCYVHNQGWSVSRLGDCFVLEARSPEHAIRLLLEPKKTPVVHGVDGFCRKSERTGEGTHYYSMTRLKTSGLLFNGETPVEVTGLSWMDHEFGSYRLTPEQTGWDWCSIQLEDNRELMLCMIRRWDGSLEPASMGTLVDAHGNTKTLHADQFLVTSRGKWHSEKSGGTYPMGWNVSVPGENIDVNLTAQVKDQELNTAAPIGITYWEGAVGIEGTSNGKQVRGQGYMEMTGYSEACKQSIF